MNESEHEKATPPLFLLHPEGHPDGSADRLRVAGLAIEQATSELNELKAQLKGKEFRSEVVPALLRACEAMILAIENTGRTEESAALLVQFYALKQEFATDPDEPKAA